MPDRIRMAAIAVALVLVAAGCGAAGSPSPNGSPSVSPPANLATTPALTVAPATTPLPSPRGAVRGRDWEWRDVWVEDPLGLSPSLAGVIFTGAGFTAWGPNSAGGSALLTSTSNLDGWGQTGDPRQFDGIGIIGLAWAPAGIVALGADKAGLVHAWVSTDGATWKAGPTGTGINGTVNTVTSSSGGIYYAAGTAKGGCDVAIWFSYDGLTWQPSEALSGASGTCSTGGTSDGPKITLLRDGGAGLVAYGTVPGLGSAFWTSTDDVHWTFHPQPSLGGHVAGLANGREGYIAVGTVGTGGAAVWMSANGVAWTRSPDQTDFAGAAMSDVRSLDDGSFVAVGSDADHVFLVWTSTDGLAWVLSPAPLYSNSEPLSRSDHPVNWELASDGHASTNPSELLIAVAGGSRAMVSPPTTPDLRAGSLTISLSGRVNLPTETVTGICADSGDETNSTTVRAVLVNLAAPNPADVSLIVSRDGGVSRFMLGMDNLNVDVGVEKPVDPSMFTVGPGSTVQHGSAEFRGLVDTLSPIGARLLSGSLAWTCAW